MDTIKFGTAEYVAENNSYLFEERDSAAVEVDVLSNGMVDFYLIHADYQSKALRDWHRVRFEESGSAFHRQRAERQYAWDGVDVDLTPKQARKLAKALKRAAKAAESRD